MVTAGETIDLGLFDFTFGVNDSGVVGAGTTIPGMADTTSTVIFFYSDSANGDNALTLKGTNTATLFRTEIRDLESPMTVRFYDLNGNLVHTETRPSAGHNSLIIFEVEMPEGISFHSISFDFRAGDGISLDNISVGDRAQDIISNVSTFVNALPDESTYSLFSAEQDIMPDLLIHEHRLNLDSSESKQLKLSVENILSHGQEDLFVNNSSVQLVVDGKSHNDLTLSDVMPDGSDSGDWSQAGDITISGVEYTAYSHSGAGIEIFIQQGINVNLENN